MSKIPSFLQQLLRSEFKEPHCAYCHSPERLLGIPLEVDHIIPSSLDSKTEFRNLCLSCRSCNAYKHDQTRAHDPQTKRKVRLFHLRKQKWSEHFKWNKNKTRIIGRATVEALQMNNKLITNLRSLWVILGLHPIR